MPQVRDMSTCSQNQEMAKDCMLLNALFLIVKKKRGWSLD